MSKKSSTKQTPSRKAPLKAGAEEQRQKKKSPAVKDLEVEDVQVPDVVGKRSLAPTAHIESTKVEAFEGGPVAEKDDELRHENDEDKDRKKSRSSKIYQRASPGHDRTQDRVKR